MWKNVKNDLWQPFNPDAGYDGDQIQIVPLGKSDRKVMRRPERTYITRLCCF